MADGLLGRWSRRKLEAKAGKPLDDVPPPARATTAPSTPSVASPETARPVAAAEPVAAPAPDAPADLPTLEQAQALTPESDFKPFVARGVTPEVRNAAMKKLFADPHFNVMDRMDVYIDDYNLSEPIPEAMLRQMASAQFLGLFDEKKHDHPQAGPVPSPREVANGDAPAGVAHSEPRTESSPAPDNRNPDDADPDLRLQPDHAPAAPADRGGAG